MMWNASRVIVVCFRSRLERFKRVQKPTLKQDIELSSQSSFQIIDRTGKLSHDHDMTTNRFETGSLRGARRNTSSRRMMRASVIAGG